MKRKHNYKGGSIASNGYKIIYVGKEHHLADVRGYAYEHRVVAENKIGRRLNPKEQVHHLDENKLNNSIENLEVVKTLRYHKVFHRKKTQGLRMPDEPNVLIKCFCGCNMDFMKYDNSGRERKYVSGHNPIESPLQDKINLILNKGICSLTDISNELDLNKSSIKTTLSLLVKNGKIVRVKNGFYGKKGTPKIIRKKMLIKCSCGCGKELLNYDNHWRLRRFLSGHNLKTV